MDDLEHLATTVIVDKLERIAVALEKVADALWASPGEGTVGTQVQTIAETIDEVFRDHSPDES